MEPQPEPSAKPTSASSRPRRSIVPPARMASPSGAPAALPPPVSSLAQPSPVQPSSQASSASSSGAALSMGAFTLPQLKAVELTNSGTLADPSSSGGPAPTEADVEPKTEQPAPTKVPGKVQHDDDMCPSCLGPVVPSAPGGGTGDGSGNGRGAKKGQGELIWIGCEGCESWFHYACVRTRSQGLPPSLGLDTGNWKKEADMIDKWFCVNCASPTNQPTLKPTTSRKSARPKSSMNYLALHDPSVSSPAAAAGAANDWPSRFAEYERQGKITLGGYLEMRGEDVSIEAVNCRDDWESEELGLLSCPVAVRALPASEGDDRAISRMGGLMPPSSLTVRAIAELNGRDTPVEVVDVANQGSSKTVPGTNKPWTLGAWADYYDTPSEHKQRIFNIISYEISGTPLAQQVRPPKIVTDLDWVDKFWPTGDKMVSQRPKVQLYCLMSPGGCFTDWHVDFAGSSVYYHILKGSKVFWFIRPTKANLDAYAKWSDSSNQDTAWLGDKVDKVTKIVLNPGDTMIIPSGVIHAVYTPSDSLVFGGNFLHSYDIKTQIRMRDIEIATKVPQKFRFPRFTRLCWYVADHYNRELQATQKLRPLKSTAASVKAERSAANESASSPGPPQPHVNGSNSNGAPAGELTSARLLDNLACLTSFLVRQIRHRERGTVPDGEKEVDTVPWEKVKDPSCLARELRWRVKMADGEQSDDEEGEGTVNGAGKKGKSREKAINGLVQEREMDVDVAGSTSSKRRRLESAGVESDPKYVPKRPWDASEWTAPVISSRTIKLAMPGSTSTAPTSVTETTRLDTQVQTRQQYEENGNLSVEISTSNRQIVKLEWASPPSAAPQPLPVASTSTGTPSAPPKKRVKKAPVAAAAQSSPAGPSALAQNGAAAQPKPPKAPRQPKQPKAQPTPASAPAPAQAPVDIILQHQERRPHPPPRPRHQPDDPHYSQPPSHPHHPSQYPSREQQLAYSRAVMEQENPPALPTYYNPASQAHPAPGAWLNSPSAPHALPGSQQAGVGGWPPFDGQMMDVDPRVAGGGGGAGAYDPTYGMLGGVGGGMFDDGMGGGM